ncbi:623_t:CDS:2, partial [Dentiscutata heterogama]
MPKRTTLTEEQKNELCTYACWGLRVDESTISRILKTSEEQLGNGISNFKTKHHRAVIYPELDLALKEFVLIYQHRTVLTDALLVKKAKVLADSLEIPQGTLNFSSSWLYKFKNRNGIRLQQLQGEATSANMDSAHGRRYHYEFQEELSSPSCSDFCQTTNPVLNDIADALNALDLLDSMQVEEYLAISEENIVYEVLSNDQVITELVKTFRTNEPTNINLKDEDDSFEAPIVSTNTAIASLKTMRMFLLQQDCTEEYVNFVRRIEKFIKKTK